ncbi:hypothetical protein IIE26_19740 [Cytobacillus oceanisediminis]|uniref:hypothetical protein n=1 Tax=Cytobacillus oceanisediminis TaxID=665099 RepID=UPI001864064B|nr:hypothetical protein [Cytobacillus oceanisediminis]QOK25891.1 hypothetical protein IIE26_19740 [Cytobacillus oceanisediminis]
MGLLLIYRFLFSTAIFADGKVFYLKKLVTVISLAGLSKEVNVTLAVFKAPIVVFEINVDSLTALLNLTTT